MWFWAQTNPPCTMGSMGAEAARGLVRYAWRITEQLRQSMGVRVQGRRHASVPAGNGNGWYLSLHRSRVTLLVLLKTRRVCLDSCCSAVTGLENPELASFLKAVFMPL